MRRRVSMLAALLACACGSAYAAVPATAGNGASPLVPTTAVDAARVDPAATATPLYTVASGLFDPAAPDLGLQPAPGTETITVFAPTPDQDRFNNGAVLVAFKGRLYAQWQSSRQDEDSADTWVAMSHSDDGRQWSTPQVLRPAGRDGVMHSNGGWWTDGETLVAYINVWPTGFQSKDGGWTEYMLSRDGRNWSPPQRVLDADGTPVEGVIEQDPQRLADGRIVTAFHLRPGMHVAPHVTDDPLGIRGWRRGAMVNHPHDEPRVSRELEPSVFLRRRDGRDCAVMVFRDQADSWRQLASESCDGGLGWTSPTLTAMPDSRAKQSAGNLPDGSAFLVNAPNADRVRIPLAVTLSADGHLFDRAFLLRGRSDLPALRHEGRYKRPGYHYPKSLVWNGDLYVAYAVNKEDIAVTRVPLQALRGAPVP
ncbi:exo-alpha-sialidase [Xanthomonas sp. XNM01]|nr:sialidase family protein [Xanthomonas sp. XNM01]MBD9370861.1 exo-alpha-sialidase [Xanthomonas sp. XNM01]